MIKYFLLFSLLFTGGLWANSYKSSYDIRIESLDFTKPQSEFGGSAGSIAFQRFDMFTKDLTLTLDNSEEIFNSLIILKPEFIGLQGPFISFGLAIQKNSFFHDMERAKIEQSKFYLNDLHFSFFGSDFDLTLADSRVKLNDFTLFCQRFTSQRVDEVEDVFADCMTQGVLIGNTEHTLAKLDYTLFSGNWAKDPLVLKGDVKSLMLQDRLIKVDATNLWIDLPANFVLSTKKIELECKKSHIEVGADFDYAELWDTCTNEIEIRGAHFNIDDGKDNTSYKLIPNFLRVKDETLEFDVEKLRMGYEESVVSLNNMTLRCLKSPESELFNFVHMLGDCVKSGHAEIGIIDNVNLKKERNPIVKIAVGVRDAWRRFLRKITGKKVTDEESEAEFENSVVKDLQVTIENGRLEAEMKVKILGKFPTIRIEGAASFDQEKQLLILTLEKAKWRKISLTRIVMGLLKKYVVKGDVQLVDKHSIAISFAPKEK